MAMKKIKAQFGKVVPPLVSAKETDEIENEIIKVTEPAINSDGVANENIDIKTEVVSNAEDEKSGSSTSKNNASQQSPSNAKEQIVSHLLSEPNPFLQTKEIFGRARLTKVGYRVRTDFVEILDFIKKMKKNGYTLEAVLDDALAFYFKNSEDGREAIKKAEAFYS